VAVVLIAGASSRLEAQTCLVDPSFIPALEPGADIYGMAVQPDGKLLIGGAFVAAGSIRVTNLARLNIDGSLDPTFDPLTAVDIGYVNAITIQPDGQILVGGNFYSSLSLNQGIMTRLNPDGSEDPSFDYNLFIDTGVNTILLQPDGKIVIGGAFVVVDFLLRRNIARLNANGTLDATFDACVASSDGAGATSLTLLSDGKILATGSFSFSTGYTRNGLARLRESGDLDPDFAPEPGVDSSSSVFALRMRPDGRLLMGGNFRSYHSVPRAGLVQLTAEGEVDFSFDPADGIEAGGSVFTIALQSDGKAIAGGSFTNYSGVPYAGVARINTNGVADPVCNPGAGANNWVSTLLLQPNGKLLTGGKFSRFNGSVRNGICLLQNGSVQPRLSLPVFLNDALLMSLYGEIGVQYVIEASSNFTDWMAVTNFTAIAAKQTIRDPDAASSGARFYRARTN